MTVREIALRAKAAADDMRLANTEQKNKALLAMADTLRARTTDILTANQADIVAAEKNGIARVMIDRLMLNEQRIEGLCRALHEIAALPDPIGSYDRSVKRPNGLLIHVKRVPLGLIGLIYESRPNVTVDSAALCLKSGNAVLLRGGKEAIQTNKVLAAALREGLEKAQLSPDAVCLIEDTGRGSAQEMMELTGILDVLIPRGGAGLIRSVTEHSRVPVIETGAGNCHVYIDRDADLTMAQEIVFNAKCQRPSVCNACETVLVDRFVAAEFLPMMKNRLDAMQVELRGCPEAAAILGESVIPATDEDWGTEYNDYILAVRVVGGLYEATAHINRHSTKHSEAIVTGNTFTAQRFTDRVDSACVYVNASTRFTDGEVFGFGGEIGISTQKLHARGPLGLEHLTSVQYIVQGEGHIR